MNIVNLTTRTKETIKYAEKLLDSLFRSGVSVDDISASHEDALFFMWSTKDCAAMISVRSTGRAIFSFSSKKEPHQMSSSWQVGQKIPDCFYEAQKVMTKDN